VNGPLPSKVRLPYDGTRIGNNGQYVYGMDLDAALAEIERLRTMLAALVADCERLGFAEISVELSKPFVAARAYLEEGASG